jgi:hypothetical protein
VTVAVGVSVHGWVFGRDSPRWQQVASLLKGFSFECTVLRDPDERGAREFLRGLRGSMPEPGGRLRGDEIPRVRTAAGKAPANMNKLP